MKQKMTTLLLSAILIGGILSSKARAQLTVASNNKSTFTIVLAKDALPENVAAAQELHKCVQIATGVELPIQRDDVEIATPVISIGNNHFAAAAGIANKEIPYDGFRIVTRDGNVYIIGNDTPAGEYADLAGKSYGTANGVYTFLEDYLNVRWLMPGDLGRDVPVKSTFTIPEIDRSETPVFTMRRLPHVLTNTNQEQFAQIKHWENCQRLGGATWFSFNHNWLETVKPELFKTHPDWFAMINGKRVPATKPYGKFETTNPEVIEYFADKAIETLKKSSRPNTFSLSPSDGRGWSESPQSKALYDPSPNTVFDPEAKPGLPSMSSLILKWYHDVAQIVAQKYPQGKLAGYIYADYLFPPVKEQMKLPDNFTPVIAPSFDYGYALYRPKTQEQLEYVLSAWEKVVPEKWYCFDLPNTLLRQHNTEIGSGNFPGSTGTVTPAAPDILNMYFKTLLQNHIKGVYLYGSNSWSNAAMSNYIVAQMEWNPQLDANDVQREWLHRAYGDAAGEKMELFYEKLNNLFRIYYQQNADVSYMLTQDILQKIYAAHYGELESLFLNAKQQTMTEVQARRLDFIENNLIALQWRLRNAGFLDAKSTFSLQRSDDEVITLLQSEDSAFPLFPGIIRSQSISDVVDIPKPYSWKVKVADSLTNPENKFDQLPGNTILLYAQHSGPIKIAPDNVTHGKYVASYQIKNAGGQEVAGGIWNKNTPVIFNAKKDSAYYLILPQRKTVHLSIKIENAQLTDAAFANNVATLKHQDTPTLVFYNNANNPLKIHGQGNDVLVVQDGG